MKALWKSKTGTRVVEVDEMPTPSRGQILVNVKSASFNRADYAGMVSTKGRIVGSDIAGVVHAVGEDVQGFAVGDRVCAVTPHLNGGFAEFALANQKWAAHLPDKMGFADGAAIPTAGVTALAAIEKARCGIGTSIFVCGASGGVGQYAVALAKAAGANVVAACGAHNLDIPLAAGADTVIDYTHGLDDAPSEGHDTALLINGSFKSEDLIKVLRTGGRLVLVGADSLRPSILSVPFQRRRLSIATFFAIIGKDGLQRAVDAISAAGFHPTIELCEGFESAKKALDSLAKRHPKGKVVTTFGD